MAIIEIYYQPASVARETGSLDAYRNSAREIERTRDVIDREITASFDGWHLGRECLDNVLQECSAGVVAIVLAATLAARDGDGRFTRAGRTWAAGIMLPALAAGDRAAWYACRAHSAVLDGFITLFRQRQG